MDKLKATALVVNPGTKSSYSMRRRAP
jgi:hypothetical protein